jgi:hypothetical protein
VSIRPQLTEETAGVPDTAIRSYRDNQYLMIDSTIVRAHQRAASGKGGPKIRRWETGKPTGVSMHTTPSLLNLLV